MGSDQHASAMIVRKVNDSDRVGQLLLYYVVVVQVIVVDSYHGRVGVRFLEALKLLQYSVHV